MRFLRGDGRKIREAGPGFHVVSGTSSGLLGRCSALSSGTISTISAMTLGIQRSCR